MSKIFNNSMFKTEIQRQEARMVLSLYQNKCNCVLPALPFINTPKADASVYKSREGKLFFDPSATFCLGH